MTEKLIYFFGGEHTEPDPPDRRLLGGKGAALMAMTQAGLPVPPGFTISAAACEPYFRGDEAWRRDLFEQVRAAMIRLETLTGRGYARGEKPLLVSVRSGAAMSMPGMMDTVLNCGVHPGLAAAVGDTPAFWRVYLQFILMFTRCAAGIEAREFTDATGLSLEDACAQTARRYHEYYRERLGRPFPEDPFDALYQCIDTVFCSWNNERALAYRKRNDIRGLLGTAVNVQSMFPAEISGVLFTRDPADLDTDHMIIEASLGLGEAVVSGDVTPDRFIVERSDFSRFRTVAGNKCSVVTALGARTDFDREALCLDAGQVRELCEIALRVEGYFDGVAQDIEWAWADGRFGLLQSRRIRGLDIARDVEVGRREEIERLRHLAAGGRKLWVRHNLDETLSHPTPLTWDIVSHFMSGDGGFGRLYQDLGYQPAAEVRAHGFLELVGGRIYVDIDRLPRLFWKDLPMTYDLQAVLRDKRLLESAPTRFDPESVEPTFFFKLPAIVRSLLACSRRVKRLRREAARVFEQEALPPYLDYLARERAADLESMETDAIITRLQERIARVLDDFGKESLKPGFAGGLALAQLQARLTQLLGEEEGTRLAVTLTSGMEDSTTAQNILLHEVAAGKAELERFLREYGHRAVGEMELATERWREDPGVLDGMLQGLARAPRGPREIHAENHRKREAAFAGLRDTLAQWGGSCFHEEVDALLREAWQMLPYRETGKHYLMMGYELIRRVIMELSRRWDLGRDVFFLRLGELAEFESHRQELQARIEQRKLRWQSARRLDLPEVIDSNDLDNLGKPMVFDAAAELQGDAMAAGIATGPARIVFDPREAGDLGHGYILVCPSTDPGWTALFVNAGGLIVERGGVLSHGAIVARDFGIPAVACAHATKRVKDGQAVKVDGNSGRIALLDEGDDK